MAQYRFINETQLVPQAVAHRKFEELCPAKWRGSPLHAWFVEHCGLRCEALWIHNSDFRRVIGVQNPKERLYSYVSAWFNEFKADPIRYRTLRPHSSLEALIA